MKAVAGAVFFLAGMALLAGGLVGHAILVAAKINIMKNFPIPIVAVVAGAIIGVIGIKLLINGWTSDSSPRSAPDGSRHGEDR